MKNKELLNYFTFVEYPSKLSRECFKNIWSFKIIMAVICCSYVKVSYFHRASNLIPLSQVIRYK